MAAKKDKMTILTRREQLYIQQHYLTESVASMARRFGVSTSPIRDIIRYWGLEIPRETKLRFRIESLTGRSTATPAEDRYIRKHYLTMPVKRIAENLGRVGSTFVSTRIRQLGLTIPPEIIEQRKKDSQLKPGNRPVNKGKKMSKSQYQRCAPTMFKPGQKPANRAKRGTIRTRPDRRGVPQLMIKISDGHWEYLSRYTWRRANGNIPRGMCIAFRDGNTLNCDLSNLVMISQADNMKRNTLHQYPKELQEVIILNNKLKRTIRHAKKQNK